MSDFYKGVLMGIFLTGILMEAILIFKPVPATHNLDIYKEVKITTFLGCVEGSLDVIAYINEKSDKPINCTKISEDLSEVYRSK